MSIPNRIPTLVGILLVIAVVGTIVFFTERALRAPSGASGSYQPTHTKITNSTDSSFVISWTTESPATGTVLVSTAGKSNRIYYDERDAGGKLMAYTAHFVAVRDAQASTQYSMKILSNGRQFLLQGKPYEMKTPAKLAPNVNGLEPAYGTIRTPQGLAADGALVYLTLDGGQELAALTKSSGLWLIPLTQVRTADLGSLLPTSERMNETILVRHESGEIAATTDSLNDSPVPEMTIGQTYDFRGQNAQKTTTGALALGAPPAPPAGGGQLPVGGTVLGSNSGPYRVTLATPAQNSSIATTLPLISGTGVPNKFVSIQIGITQPTSGSVQVKADGTWSFTPPKPLSTGKQSVTMTTVDGTGKTIAMTHAFEILKSGTQVLGDATPSGTLTLTPTPTLADSTESATEESSTLSGSEIPTSGYELPTILLVVIGFGLLISGIIAAGPIGFR